MVWVTFLLAGYLMAYAPHHITIHIIDYVAKGRWLAAVKLFVNLVILGTCLFLIYGSYTLVTSGVDQVTPAGGLSCASSTLCPLSGFVLVVVRVVLAIVIRDVPDYGSRRGRGMSVRAAHRDDRAYSFCVSRWHLRSSAVRSSTSWSRAITPHLAVRLVMQGIDSWPLLAVPLFILVESWRHGRRSPIGSTTPPYFSSGRSGRSAYVNIAVSLGFSWMSGAALADAAGIGSIEVTHMRKKGYPAEFSVGLSASCRPDQPDHAAEHPGGRVSPPSPRFPQGRCSWLR